MAEQVKNWNASMLSKEETEIFEHWKRRKTELQDARKEEQFGVVIEDLWRDGDRDYQPHRLKLTGKKGNKKLEQDEVKGWASTFSKIGASNWQSDIAQPNPYKKIQIALSILVDQNPSGIFTPASKKFQATTELIKQLYERSWEKARSKEQLKLFIFNLCKYGWATARTYPLRITRKVKELKDFNQENPDKSVYEEREVIEYNDIFRENLDPWNVWIDDMAKPNDPMSVRDWSWRKVYSMDKAKEEFGAWKNFKYVKAGGIVTDKIEDDKSLSKKYTEKDLVEVYFYENVVKDMFTVEIGGVPVIMTPLPISDSQGHKKLSLWQTYWTLRHASCPYGIGMYEAMKNNNQLYDVVSNMSIDQLVLSIYKMFFYQGTQQLTNTGEIKIKPGVGQQTLDPKNINFLEVPGPGQDALNWRELIRRDLDEDSGITDPLLGQVTGKTAFEIAQAKESALKRLKTPLDNVTDALNTEAYISVALMQLLYSIPEVYTISDPELIDAYLKEVESDPQLYQRTEDNQFQAKVYPEFPLNLDKDEKGMLVETADTRFFRVKPDSLPWDGLINVKAQSVLTPSKQLDKTLDLEMYQMILPLLAQPPQIYSKAVKEIIKLYDKDPSDILPEMWMLEPEQLQQMQAEQEPLIIPLEDAGGQPPQVPPTTQPGSPSPVSAMSAKMGNFNL